MSVASSKGKGRPVGRGSIGTLPALPYPGYLPDIPVTCVSVTVGGMREDVYELRVLRRPAPRSVDGEVHVDVRGRAFAVADHPVGAAILERPRSRPDDTVYANVCRAPDQAIGAK
jgi:hypothetical protein